MVQLGLGWVGLKWGFGDGQAATCMGRCMGDAWLGAWMVVVVMLWEWEKCMCLLPGLVGLDLGYGEGLNGDGEEVISVVS